MTACVARRPGMAIDSKESGGFKRTDAASYDSLAHEYDRFEAMRAPLVARLFSIAQIRPGENVLDVGTGTGIVALEAARIGRVIGVDLSSGLLQHAHQKARSAGIRLPLVRTDAERLPIADESFDVIVSLYALLHFPDPLQALRETLRCLRPGGRAVIAIGSGPPRLSLGGWLHRASRLPDALRLFSGRLLIAPRLLDGLVRRLAPGSSGAEQTHLAAKSTVRGERVRTLMEHAGFTNVNGMWEGYEQEFADPEEFWLLQTVYSSFSRKRLAELTGDQQAHIKREFISSCVAVQKKGGRLIYPFAAYFTSGRRL